VISGNCIIGKLFQYISILKTGYNPWQEDGWKRVICRIPGTRRVIENSRVRGHISANSWPVWPAKKRVSWHVWTTFSYIGYMYIGTTLMVCRNALKDINETQNGRTRFREWCYSMMTRFCSKKKIIPAYLKSCPQMWRGTRW
jgi:hypothetical protein